MASFRFFEPIRAIRRLCLGLTFVLLALSSPWAAAGEGGLFVLHNAGRPFDPAILQSDAISGVALQIGWTHVERQEGQYDWSRIDEVIEAARRHNKRVTIHLMPLFPPQWVYNAGVEPFSFTMNFPWSPNPGRTETQFIPWDPVFLKKWAALTRQLGKRYNADPAVFAVSVTAPMPEMVLPGGIPGSDAFRRLEAIYSKSVYLAAWKQMIDVYAEAFPDKPKFIAPGVVLVDEYFADDVLQYARQRYGDRLWVFNAGLHAEGTAVARILRGHIQSLLEDYAKKSHLGFQTIWSATEDRNNRMRGPLRRALEYAARLGAEYVEVYEADAGNASLQEDLRYAAGLLRNGARAAAARYAGRSGRAFSGPDQVTNLYSPASSANRKQGAT